MENPSSSRQISLIRFILLITVLSINSLIPYCFSALFTFYDVFVCVFIGTDALCWEQELHWAWSASSGGLLFVHKLFCCGPIPPHCRVRQSGPCFEETSFVSTDFCVHTFLSITFGCLTDLRGSADSEQPCATCRLLVFCLTGIRGVYYEASLT